MNSPRFKWIWPAVAVAIAIIIAGVVARSREPKYKGRPLTAWIKDTESTDTNTRWEAREALKAMGAAAVPYLTNSLAQWNSILARSENGGKKNKRIINSAAGAMRWRSPKIESLRAAAALAVIGTNATEAIPHLIAAFEDTSVRWAAAEALVEVGPAALPALRRELGNPENTPVALYIFQRMGTNAAPAASDVVPFLASTNASNAQVAQAALVRMGPAAIPAVTNRLTDTNPAMRAGCLAVIHNIVDRPESSRPAVLPLLHDPVANVRYEALMAYSTYGDRPVVQAPIWVEAMKDSDGKNAAFGLQMLTNYFRNVRTYSNEIAALALRPEPALRSAASNALARLKP